jgi:hypothetical protein
MSATVGRPVVPCFMLVEHFGRPSNAVGDAALAARLACRVLSTTSASPLVKVWAEVALSCAQTRCTSRATLPPVE